MDLTPAHLREVILRMAHTGQTAHAACALSLVEIVSVLYGGLLTEGDRVILSKGHGVMALYAALSELGIIPREELERYNRGGTLKGCCEEGVPGLEVTSGSLGHGFPIAAGIAKGMKLMGKPGHVYVIAGDGEMNEGSMWEAALFCAHHKLNNLTLIIDANGFQAMGRTDEVMGLEPLVPKLEAFGFVSAECDGHDVGALRRHLLFKAHKPKALIARTVKGKGVSFMEDTNAYHYGRVTDELLALALEEVHGDA